MKEIFLENLPKKYGIGANKDKLTIDWKNSIGYKVHFIYDDIEDDLEIINYESKSRKLTILYKNKTMDISPVHFTECRFGNILNKVTKPSASQSNLLKLLPDGGFVIDYSIGGSFAYVVYNKEIYQYQNSGTNSLTFVLTQPIEQFTIPTNIWDYAFNYINLRGDRI